MRKIGITGKRKLRGSVRIQVSVFGDHGKFTVFLKKKKEEESKPLKNVSTIYLSQIKSQNNVA